MINIDSIYKTYRNLEHSLPRKIKWLAYIFAPWKLSLIVAISGIVSIIGSLVVTYGVSLVGQNFISAPALLLLLCTGFVCEGIGLLVKSRFEILLTVCVRQLSYRRFKSLYENHYSGEHRKSVLTYPGQISQFSYVVDASISFLNIVAFFFLTLILYGFGGLIAIVLIALLVVVSVRLIHLIGKLWEQYVGLEGKRRHGIQLLAEAMPRGPRIPSWKKAVQNVVNIRSEEEVLLRKRVGLQVINGFLDNGALTFTLCLVVIASALFWPESGIGIGIILAARYFYSSVQNNLVNYRVIRLAFPMMRELDALEAQCLSTEFDEGLFEHNQVSKLEVVQSGSKRAIEMLAHMHEPNYGYIPRNPKLHQSVLTAWFEAASIDMKIKFEEHALALGLSKTVLVRAKQDSSTLSSGETHRMALAMVLVDNPQTLILEDTFAALDPKSRELVANHVARETENCILISSSLEYVPTIFFKEQCVSDEFISTEMPVSSDVTEALGEDNLYLPDPDVKKATIWRTIKLLFGPLFSLVIIGAGILVTAEIAFALAVSHENTMTPHLAFAATGIALFIVIGCLLYFITIYYVPIRRLGALHEHIMWRLDRFATKNTSGAILGRLGEDFSELQMDIPATLGSVFQTLLRTVLLVGLAAVDSPLFFLLILVVIPLAYGAYNFGSKLILSETTQQANARGEFLGAVGIQAGLHGAPVSSSMQAAGQRAYRNAEKDYLSASIRLTNAYFLRDGLIQLMVLGLEIMSVAVAVLLGTSSLAASPVIIIYFAITLSTGIQSTIEVLQEVGVVGLTSERVTMLQTLSFEYYVPEIRDAELKLIKEALKANETLIGIIGPTGAGKSVLLERLAREYPKDSVCLIPDVDPLDESQEKDSGIALADKEILSSDTKILMLDETFKSLESREEREKLLLIKSELQKQGRQALVVMHSRSNLDIFDVVISLDNKNAKT